ncbi:hypothetical protein JOB18_038916 [Solea senegalensis]|uniref:Uncharacterized protein n=1 Tax=Solea senegalensis TaxID=28829 RepID=A0AAV6PIN3_SOLSE|nr:hypothetical protein JOB18_038916 [Solea senegalensis]
MELQCPKKTKVETGQLELTVEQHNGCCEGLEVAVLSSDYCPHELNWMHKEKRAKGGGGRGGGGKRTQHNNEAGSLRCPISQPVSESTGFLNGCHSLLH